MKLVDTHCHIYGESYKEDLDEVLARAGEDLEFIVNIGYDLNSSQIAVELANKYPFAYATVGVHPTDISGYSEEVEEKLLELAKNKKVVAIGEIGLDYYWMKDPKEVQAIYFRKQMDLARKLNLPVVIHTRDAMEDTVNILNEYKDIRGIMHCFPGSYETAKTLMDRYYFGVAGVLTFKNNVKTREFVEKMPLEKLLIETDSPYLTPVPYRGKRNEPSYVEFVAKEIANIKGISYEEVVKVTTKNAKIIYGMKE
jgi:TatD DNase family protein